MKPTQKLILSLPAFLFSALPFLSQGNAAPKPLFDVVSIKPTAPGTPQRGGGPRGDRFTMGGVTLKTLLQSAYQRSTLGTASDFQVIGGPAWMDDDRYDVDAKADCSGGPISRDRFQLMVQSFLQNRFHLRAHLEPREVPFYDLVVGKNGPKIKAAADQSPLTSGAGVPALCAPPAAPAAAAPRVAPFDPTKTRGFLSMKYAPGSATATGNAVAINTLMTILRMEAGRPISNKTNLEGLYDFTLQFSPELMSTPYSSGARGGATEPAVAADPVATLFTAIQEQLGLKLEPSKGEIQVLVVESVQKPTLN